VTESAFLLSNIKLLGVVLLGKRVLLAFYTSPTLYLIHSLERGKLFLGDRYVCGNGNKMEKWIRGSILLPWPCTVSVNCESFEFLFQ